MRVFKKGQQYLRQQWRAPRPSPQQTSWLRQCTVLDITLRFQEEIQPMPYSELTDLKIIGQGGFGHVYKAKHGRFGTVVYKELDAKKLGDQ